MMPLSITLFLVRKNEEEKICNGWKARKQKMFHSLVQWNNERGKKVMWDPQPCPQLLANV